MTEGEKDKEYLQVQRDLWKKDMDSADAALQEETTKWKKLQKETEEAKTLRKRGRELEEQLKEKQLKESKDGEEDDDVILVSEELSQAQIQEGIQTPPGGVSLTTLMRMKPTDLVSPLKSSPAKTVITTMAPPPARKVFIHKKK